MTGDRRKRRARTIVRLFRHHPPVQPLPRFLPRMALPVDLKQLRGVDVRIARGRAEARVAEQFLDHAQVGGHTWSPLRLRFPAPEWKARAKRTTAHELIFSTAPGKPISPNNILRVGCGRPVMRRTCNAQRGSRFGDRIPPGRTTSGRAGQSGCPDHGAHQGRHNDVNPGNSTYRCV